MTTLLNLSNWKFGIWNLLFEFFAPRNEKRGKEEETIIRSQFVSLGAWLSYPIEGQQALHDVYLYAFFLLFFS